MKNVRDAGISISMNNLHNKLAGIREVMNVFSNGKKKAATQSVITKMDEVQKRLFELFEMQRYSPR